MPPVCWPVFLQWFPHCDNIWAQQRRLRARLRDWGSAYQYQSENEKTLLDDLDAEHLLFRGCHTRYRKGLSWALDYERAEAFSRRLGGRAGSGNVYEAMIAKRDIFAIITRQEELFVLLDYKRLQDIQRVDDGRISRNGNLTFEPKGYYRDDNNDGKSSDLNLRITRGRETFRVAQPPIENMRQEPLEAMLAQAEYDLRFELNPSRRALLKAVTRRASGELAARKDGAIPGRKTGGLTGHKIYAWGQKNRKGGRPTTASRNVTLPPRECPPPSNDDHDLLPIDEAA